MSDIAKRRAIAYSLLIVSGFLGAHRLYLERFGTAGFIAACSILGMSLEPLSFLLSFTVIFLIYDIGRTWFIASGTPSLSPAVILEARLFAASILTSLKRRPTGIRNDRDNHKPAISAAQRSKNRALRDQPIPRMAPITAKVNVPVEIDYVTLDNSREQRKVIIHNISTNSCGELGFSGHCTLRGEKRNFLVSGVLELLNLETGEVFDRTQAAHHIWNLAAESDTGIAQRAIAQSATGFPILLYIARANGNISLNERRVLHEFLRTSSGLAIDEKAFQHLCANQHVDAKQFRSSLRNIPSMAARERKALRASLNAIHRLKSSAEPMTRAAISIVAGAIHDFDRQHAVSPRKAN